MRLSEDEIEISYGKTILFYQSITESGKRRGIYEHHHTAIEISLCCKGSGAYIINGKEHPISPYDIIIHASDEPHYLTKIIEGEAIEMLNIRFEPMLLWSDKELSWLMQFFMKENRCRKNKISSSNPIASEISRLFLEIKKEVDTKNVGYELMVKTLLINILVIINRAYTSIPENYQIEGVSHTSKQLEKALMFINDNIENKLTLDIIAQSAAMNKTYFSSCFKKLNGISLWDYITIKRVEKAIELLKTTNLTKIDIAMKCGFNSSANFYKAFRRVTGKNPSFFSRGNN
jgi:AraC-like DNA-binding protein